MRENMLYAVWITHDITLFPLKSLGVIWIVLLMLLFPCHGGEGF